ncbi:MAG: primosomal protein N' [Anaerolineales bacterium]|nr:primosomal protein N' [Anaerolineales bacterium]
MYAEILPNVPRLKTTFHYRVPDALWHRLRVGHLVLVSFGKQRTQGIVVALDSEPPADIIEFKPIESLLDPEPVLTRNQLDLAYWLAHRYFTTLIDCIALMLPPGLSQRADIRYELLAEEFSPQTKAQRNIVRLLSARGALLGRQLGRALPRRNWRAVADRLARKGVLRKTAVLAPPAVRPKHVRTVRLTASPERIEAAKTEFVRRSVPVEILEYLIGLWPGEPALDDLLHFVGCQRRHVSDLSRRGWLTLASRQQLLVKTVSDDVLRRWLQKRERAAPRQSQVVRALLGSRSFMPMAEIPPASAGVLEALKSQDLLRVSVNPERVQLQINPAQAKAEVTRLRKPDAKTRVLQFMRAQSGEPVAVGRVYAQTGARLADLTALGQRGLLALAETEIIRDSLRHLDFVPTEPPMLVEGQRRAWRALQQAFDEPEPKAFLLHGVTGAGKTEIYMRAVAAALRRGKQAIVLVPEIALTPQTVRRFFARFPGRVGLLHSQLSVGERYDTWRRARCGDLDVLVGARSALFAPLPRIGVIAVDEEHEEAYRQDPPVQPPHYNARDVAVEYARRLGAVCILGSATPDLVSAERAKRGEYQLLTLPERIMGHAERISGQAGRLQVRSRYRPVVGAQSPAQFIPMPRVRVVDMRHELRAGNRSMFSRALQRALNKALKREQQAILFLNRRGHATYVFCRDCGHTLECPRCGIPFTYHRTPNELICHHCNRRHSPVTRCPQCGGRRIKHFGVGTEAVQAEVHRCFPAARTLRWDWDVTRRRGAHEQILRRFSEREADVLIGTQMIAKGLDLPLVTLVGAISCDVGLSLPDYRAAERTFQVLTQVAGRAGRGLLGGQALLQTYMPEHHAIQAAAAHDYAAFFEHEIELRKQHGYPPFGKLARLIGRDPSLARVEADAQKVAAQLRARIRAERANSTDIIGPAPCFFGRVARQHRWQVVLRGPDPAALLNIEAPAGWRVELDPLSLL